MTLTVKLTLIVTLILSIILPFGYYLIGEKNDTDGFVIHNFLQGVVKLTSFVYNNTVYAGESHSCVRIDIITDQKHLHNYNLPKIMKEMISP